MFFIACTVHLAGEILELEAAKMVASAFESDDLSNEAKVVVMCSVLLRSMETQIIPKIQKTSLGGKHPRLDMIS